MIKLSDFFYYLPENLIAQAPKTPRDTSKLMVIDRKSETILNKHFFDLPDLLNENDVLVLNNTKVFPARIKGKNFTGKLVEVLLLRQVDTNSWWGMSFPGLKIGNRLNFETLEATVVERDTFSGQVLLQFNISGNDLFEKIFEIGTTPIPPYIKNLDVSHKQKEINTESNLRKNYQTVFSKHLGSAAAPTAGLHFTKELIAKLKAKGVQIEYITLHVGPGTFQRLWQENIDTNTLHTEWYQITKIVTQKLIKAKKAGKRIIAVGTTVTRTLESAYNKNSNTFLTGWNSTQLFITPAKKFNFVDALITNFHVPESSLLMLVTAFASYPQTPKKFINFKKSLIGKAYRKAIDEKYRFFSFGDAMFVT